MIGKGRSISHTGAAISYGCNKEKEAEMVYSQHICGIDPSEITEEFKIVQSQNHRCERNTLSFAISPTIEDGKELSVESLGEIAQKFLREMNLREHQAVAYVHRDKEHTHVHVYANRIGFDGTAYNDSFIGKQSQLAAERVAHEMGLTTVREVQQQRLAELKIVREQIRDIHEKVMKKERIKDFDKYINAMQQREVTVIPSINKQNQLQGFRFEYQGHNLKGSEVHRSMSMGNISRRIEWNKDISKQMARENTIKLLGKSVGLSPNLAATIAKKVIKIAIQKSIGLGMEI
ncbi:relaxase/mobilization nuclease domain-containing protein [Flavobacteriaceae bacterium F89]|uniref:Relaxase/mobilization nuclease domain-containing protein n=1 Tax=Cerina litoralis TaxID=2874477 RepID=A0AAE3JPR4_9FLAO|nr:relaxase/mobilization nuclease domain-containing protein [Cerina litoralis]MCG2462390.1 relaxase/mobilization nuclease domain-containing protein [Cerina litoralis]